MFTRKEKAPTTPPKKPEIVVKAKEPPKPSVARDLTEVVIRLSEVLARENEALSNHRIEILKELQDDKIALARLYEQHMQAIAKNPMILDECDQAEVAHLKEEARKMEANLETNGIRLKASWEANQRLVKAIVDAMREKAAETSVYSRAGQVITGGKKGNQIVPLSYNKTL